MNPDTRSDIVLRCCAAAFAILWTLGMLCWNGAFELHEIVILAMCGAIGGFCWYWVMRWLFKIIRTATTLANDNTLIWPTPRQSPRYRPSRPRTDG
jgi:hypothetical protein